jgi:hypothetical protein
MKCPTSKVSVAMTDVCDRRRGIGSLATSLNNMRPLEMHVIDVAYVSLNGALWLGHGNGHLCRDFPRAGCLAIVS